MSDHKIYCDEAGYSGENLLDKDQPFFVYSGIRLDQDELHEAIKLIYDNFPIETDPATGKKYEVKGNKLVKTTIGKKTTIKLFERFSRNARLVYCEKKYALACKIFEYLVEPYLASNESLYEIGFHRFVSNSIYSYFLKKGGKAEDIFVAFLAEMRGKQNAKIFEFEMDTIDDSVMKWVLDIAKYKPEIFYKQITTNGKVDTWILNLTSTSLTAILTDWDNVSSPLTVICDDSNLFEEENVLAPINRMGRYGKKVEFLGQPIGFKMTQDIVLANSKTEIGIQIADIFASALAYAVNHMAEPFSKQVYRFFVKDCLCRPNTNCILPEPEKYDERQRNEYMKWMKLIHANQRGGI